MPPEHELDRDDHRAPLLGTWRRWYTVVLATLAALVALFEFLTAHYNR
jgi:hypothetical protein